MPAKGQRMPTIDEKIERLQDQALLYKRKYEETLEQVKVLMEKREQKQQEELIAKFLKSKKSFEQVMAFLDDEDEENED